jgi:peptide/nickel transport system permease protein
MRYLVRRVFHAILLLFVISFFSFVLVQLAPGDFLDALRMNPQVSQQTINGLRSQYGLDQPLSVRYERWLRSVLGGQMGFSLAFHSSVGPLLLIRARNTLILTGTSTLLAWSLAVACGIWCATHRRKWGDRICVLATSTILTVPDVVLFLGLLFLAVRTGWFPAGGMVSPEFDDLSFWAKVKDAVSHLFLPSLGLTLVALPALVRHVRSAMIDVIEAPFLRAARGHGIPGRRLLFRYALPAAANPLLSLLGLSLAAMLSVSVLAEVILGWPGLGPLLLEAILTRDVYVVVGTIMLSSVFLIAGNLLADLLIFASDPRIRME